jgi:hypothetical protein
MLRFDSRCAEPWAAKSHPVVPSRQSEYQDHGKRGPAGQHTIGFDGFKKIKGRKRHLLVDTQGLVLKVKATGAHFAERDGAYQLLEPLRSQFPRLQIVWADQGYSGEFETWMQGIV